jgi:hypothetical protein
VLATLLAPTRVFGWGFLIYFGFGDGWLEPVKLAAVAFPLSLVVPENQRASRGERP